MATITASLFSALDGVVDPMIGQLALPVLQRGDGRGGRRHPRRRRDAVRPRHLRQLRRRMARARGRRRRRRRVRQAAWRHAQDRRLEKPLTFTWRNSEQLQGDLVDAVTALKSDPSIRRIALSGSVSIVRQLLDAGLLDELHLFVHPATAGSGLRLFDEGGTGSTSQAALGHAVQDGRRAPRLQPRSEPARRGLRRREADAPAGVSGTFRSPTCSRRAGSYRLGVCGLQRRDVDRRERVLRPVRRRHQRRPVSRRTRGCARRRRSTTTSATTSGRCRATPTSRRRWSTGRRSRTPAATSSTSSRPASSCRRA